MPRQPNPPAARGRNSQARGITVNRVRGVVDEMHFVMREPTGQFADATIPQRFEYMADEMRHQLLTRSFPQVTADAEYPYLLTFSPSEEEGAARQRTVRRISSITGEFLMELYEGMLQSQETLSLNGFKVCLVYIFLFYRLRSKSLEN
jgi:hypothetical protein